MARRFTFFRPLLIRLPYGPADVAFLLGVFLLLYGLARVGAGFFVAFRPPSLAPTISLDPANLPYYAARSTIRMFIGLGFSLLFTFAYGYACAKSRQAEKLLVPLLDVLQSVPVLGFLSVTVTGFIALFPGSLFGLECASIFAAFTAQAWNMTFSFYQSLITLPRDLGEATTVFGLSKWRRFTALEVPSAVIGLVWNGMLSFGGGWFFVVISEALTVNGHTYTLPGIGSYVAKAIDQKDARAIWYAMIAMAIVIILVDQCFWRPLVVWSEKFKMERSASGEPMKSWMLDLLRTTRIPRQIGRWYRHWAARIPKFGRPKLPKITLPEFRRRRAKPWISDDLVTGVIAGALIVVGAYWAVRFVQTEVGGREVLQCVGLGCLTLLRVMVLLVIASLVWTPIGVLVGFNPRLTSIAQPVMLFLVSFPAYFLFPLATALFIEMGLSLNWGSIILMALGAQWYILFNTVAGAMAVPSDLREMAQNMGVRGWQLWRKLIIPAIFPAWVTGAITASGGAWNASIVAEVVKWGNKTLVAEGLGSYITKASTPSYDYPRIVLGVTLMSFFVVGINKLFWRRLYTLAEGRYRLG